MSKVDNALCHKDRCSWSPDVHSAPVPLVIITLASPERPDNVTFMIYVRGGQAKGVLSPQMAIFRCSEWSFLNIYITDICYCRHMWRCGDHLPTSVRSKDVNGSSQSYFLSTKCCTLWGRYDVSPVVKWHFFTQACFAVWTMFYD